MFVKCLHCILLFNLICYTTTKKRLHYNAHFTDSETDLNFIILLMSQNQWEAGFGHRLAQSFHVHSFFIHYQVSQVISKQDRLMKLKLKELISIHIHLSCDPTNTILGYKSGEVSVHAHQKTYTRMTISIFTIIDASWKQSSLSVNKRMDKQSVAYSYNGILQIKEKNHYF